MLLLPTVVDCNNFFYLHRVIDITTYRTSEVFVSFVCRPPPSTSQLQDSKDGNENVSQSCAGTTDRNHSKGWNYNLGSLHMGMKVSIFHRNAGIFLCEIWYFLLHINNSCTAAHIANDPLIISEHMIETVNKILFIYLINVCVFVFRRWWYPLNYICEWIQMAYFAYNTK